MLNRKVDNQGPKRKQNNAQKRVKYRKNGHWIVNIVWGLDGGNIKQGKLNQSE